MADVCTNISWSDLRHALATHQIKEALRLGRSRQYRVCEAQLRGMPQPLVHTGGMRTAAGPRDPAAAVCGAAQDDWRQLRYTLHLEQVGCLLAALLHMCSCDINLLVLTTAAACCPYLGRRSVW